MITNRQTWLNQGLDAAMGLADAIWAGRTWSEDEAFVTWSIHGALLHVSGRHDDVDARLRAMGRVPPGLVTHYPTIPEAITRAGRGDPSSALDLLARGSVFTETVASIPNAGCDVVVALAAVAYEAKDEERAIRLLQTRGLTPDGASARGESHDHRPGTRRK